MISAGCLPLPMSVQKPPYLFGARLDLDPADVVDALAAAICRLHAFHVGKLDPSVVLPTPRGGRSKRKGARVRLSRAVLLNKRGKTKKKKKTGVELDTNGTQRNKKAFLILYINASTASKAQ